MVVGEEGFWEDFSFEGNDLMREWGNKIVLGAYITWKTSQIKSQNN